MSLLNKIKGTSREAADIFELADLRTDSDIRSVTREDLHELFPGHERLKLRRKIFDMIHKQNPVDALLKEMRAFIPREDLSAALSGNGVFVEYLHLLKDMKTQVDHVQGFLDAHIGLLEEFRTDQPDHESDKGISTNKYDRMETQNSQTGDIPQGESGTSGASGPVVARTAVHSQGSQNMFDGMETQNSQTGDIPRGEPGTSGASGPVVVRTAVHSQESQTAVTYKILVSGKTFGAEKQLMEKVKDQDKGQVHFNENDGDHQITILFCPICSRVGSDVEAAMSDVTDDKPVILVLMNYSREPKHVTSMRTWSPYPHVVLHVNVFYHDTMFGLLKCDQNNAAVSAIRNKLKEYSIARRQDTSRNAPGGGMTGVLEVDGNSRGSDGNRGYSFPKFPWSK